MGRGTVVGAVLLDEQHVHASSFTGSVATGQRVAAACVAPMAKFQLVDEKQLAQNMEYLDIARKEGAQQLRSIARHWSHDHRS